MKDKPQTIFFLAFIQFLYESVSRNRETCLIFDENQQQILKRKNQTRLQVSVFNKQLALQETNFINIDQFYLHIEQELAYFRESDLAQECIFLVTTIFKLI